MAVDEGEELRVVYKKRGCCSIAVPPKFGRKGKNRRKVGRGMMLVLPKEWLKSVGAKAGEGILWRWKSEGSLEVYDEAAIKIAFMESAAGNEVAPEPAAPAPPSMDGPGEDLERCSQENIRLASELEALKSELAMTRMRNDKLRSELERAETAASKERESTDSARRQRNDMKRRADELAAANEALKAHLDAAEAGDPSDAALDGVRAAFEAWPTSMCAQLDAIQALYPGRVVVTDRARKGAKECNGSVKEFWEMLTAVACDLWSIKFENEGTRRLEGAFLAATGLELAMHESAGTMGSKKMVAARKVQAGGKLYVCEPHVKGRSSKSSLRIYFAFDEENRRIVLGHCGKHLPTAGSAKKSF